MKGKRLEVDRFLTDTELDDMLYIALLVPRPRNDTEEKVSMMLAEIQWHRESAAAQQPSGGDGPAWARGGAG